MRIAKIEIDYVTATVREARERTLEVARRSTKMREKEDRSPVTNADETAHHSIVGRLRSLTPGIPVVSEESTESAGADGAHWFWPVDRLDGTRAFVDGNDEYTVNIALVEVGAPVLGVVSSPRRAAYLMAGRRAKARGASTGMRRERRSRGEASRTGPVAAISRSHSSAGAVAWLARAGVTEAVRAGSSLKSCLIAEGAVDVDPLTYGKPGLKSPHFVACGRQ